MIWKMYYEKRGDHVHCRLFVGPQRGALGLAGKICMRASEFTEFTRVRRVLGIEFITEEKPGGGPAGDLDVVFDNFG